MQATERGRQRRSLCAARTYSRGDDMSVKAIEATASHADTRKARQFTLMVLIRTDEELLSLPPDNLQALLATVAGYRDHVEALAELAAGAERRLRALMPP
jgi:hypothetical protein